MSLVEILSVVCSTVPNTVIYLLFMSFQHQKGLTLIHKNHIYISSSSSEYTSSMVSKFNFMHSTFAGFLFLL